MKGLQKGGVSWLHLERAGMGRSGPKSLSRGIFEGSTERRRVFAAFRKGWGGEVRGPNPYHEAFLKGLQEGGVSWLHLERAGMGRSGSKSLSRGIFEGSTERRRVLAALRKGWGGPGPNPYHEKFLKGLQKGGVSCLHLERAGMGRPESKPLSRGIFEGSTERRRVLAAFRKGWDGEAGAQILIASIFEGFKRRRRVLAAFRKARTKNMLPERYHAAPYWMSELTEECEQGLQTKDIKKRSVSWLQLERAGMGRSGSKSLSRGIFEGSTERRCVLAAFRKGWDGETGVQMLITRHF